MRRVLAAACAVVCTLAVVTGCGDDRGEGSSDASPSASDEPDAPVSGSSTAVPSPTGQQEEQTTIDVSFSGDTVTPSGERIEVAVNEPIGLVVTADAPGEIHVHSQPEQMIAYPAGTETFTLTIDKPGVVEVESHDLGLVIVQLEVR